MRKRAGFSLVELLVVVTITTLLLGLGIGAIRTVLELHRRVGDASRRQQETARLAEQFRDDAHAAEAFRPAGVKSGGNAWEWTLPARGTVRYAADDGLVTRTRTESDKIVERETYRLADGASAAMESFRLDEATWVRLTLRLREGEPGGQAERSVCVEARLGLHHRSVVAAKASP